MKTNAQAGNIWVDLLVVVCLLAILGAFAMPAMPGGLTKGQQTQVLSNMKQLQLATQQMAMDGETNGPTRLGWPGDTGGSFATWATNLVNGGYLTTNDLCKLLSAAGRLTPPGQIPLTNNTAVLVYAVEKSSPGNAVFLTSANFTNSPGGGLPLDPAAKPFGDKGFVVFHKGGDGLILNRSQVGPNHLDVIGAYAPLCK